jgi:hypothetical protein
VSEAPFDAAWLTLREPADAAARSAELAAAVRAELPGPLVVHDLGSGTGSMARWVSRLLPQARWVLHDHDAALLALAPDGVERRVGDLAELTADDLAGAGLVTASALLDVLTAAELEVIAQACAGRRVPALLTLTVAGRVELDPPHPLDAAVAAAFDAHQRRSGLLGPDAPDAVVRALRRHGMAVRAADSPWRLTAAEHPELLTAWLRGRAGAAVEQDPELASDVEAWLTHRLAAVAAGRLGALVVHRDLFATPVEVA